MHLQNELTVDATWITTQDFHMHSSWSDGEGSLDAVLDRCLELGLRRFAVTDHVEYGHHSDVSKRWHEYRAEFVSVQERAAQAGVDMLLGIETAVGPDGTLLAPQEIVDQADLVIASVHQVNHAPDGSHSLPEAEYWHQAQRQIEAAITNEHVDIIGHIEGYLPADFARHGAKNFEDRRRVERDIARRFFSLDWYAQVGKIAASRGIAIELHGMSWSPRYDAVRVLAEAGVRFSIGSDGHALKDIGHVGHAVALAQALNLQEDDFSVPTRRHR